MLFDKQYFVSLNMTPIFNYLVSPYDYVWQGKTFQQIIQGSQRKLKLLQ